MAEQLLFMADNLLDVDQYANHVLTASSEASGYEVGNLANGRRYEADRWQPGTANASHYWRLACDHLRGADCLIHDRGGNLVSNVRAGNTSPTSLLGSNDTFTSYRTLINALSPPTVPGGLPSASGGGLTSEGAWIQTFTADAFYDWEGLYGAMGSGITQQIVGVWLGKAYQPSDYLVDFPLQSETTFTRSTLSESPYGWRARGNVGVGRRGVLRLRCANENDYDAIRYQIIGLFGRGKPAWMIWQKSTAPWRAMLVTLDGEGLDWALDTNWSTVYRYLDVPFIEEQAALP